MEHIAQGDNMNIVYGAEHHNWVIEQTGVIKVTMEDGMTIVDFDQAWQCLKAFTNLKDYGMNYYSMCETRIIIQDL